MSSKAGLWAVAALASVTVACSQGQDRQPSLRDDGGGQAEIATNAREARALSSLQAIEDYQVGQETYLAFRQDRWPAAAVLHMDVSSGPVASADAVVVVGVAGGDPGSQEAGDAVIEDALASVDERGLCIVRGWLDGERHVAALAAECPEPVRAELDAILGSFDALTGGDARWILRFDEGVLQSKAQL